jgi:hypothetical protein
LFALPNPPCENVKAVGGRYTVIDVPFQDGWNDRVSEYTGHNHTAAFEMRPDYVKSILEPLGMLGQPIFLEKNRVGEDPDRDEVKRLEEDPELKTHLNTGMDVSNDLYMSVLADVFTLSKRITSGFHLWTMMTIWNCIIQQVLGLVETVRIDSRCDGCELRRAVREYEE